MRECGRKTGSLEVPPERQAWVKQWLPAAHKLAYQYANCYGGDQDEWVGEAYMGLIQAVQNFDQSLGFKLSTFIFRCIKTRLWHALKSMKRDYRRVLREAESVETCYGLKARREGVAEALVAPWMEAIDERGMLILRLRYNGLTMAQIAEQVGVTKERVRQILEECYKLATAA